MNTALPAQLILHFTVFT